MKLTLRAKMIGATVLMLLFVVALFGTIQVRSTTADLRQETKHLRELHINNAQTLGRATVGTLAASAPFVIAENDYKTLRAQLGPAVEAASQSSLRVEEAIITDKEGQVLASSFRDKKHRAPKALSLELLSEIKEIQTQLVMGDTQQPERVVVAAPIKDPEDRLWGYVRFVYDLQGLRDDLGRVESYAQIRRQEMITRTVGFGALILLLGVIITVLEALAITRPVLALTGTAQRLANGDLEARAVVRGPDEIGTLARTFNVMAARVQNLLKETAVKTALERELEVARIIQESILPPPGVVKAPSIRFAGYLRSASMCGGDFWAHYDMGQERTFLCVGDVTGHGVPSAMITAACRSGLDTLRAMTKGQIELEALMNQLNYTIYEAAQRKFTMTFLGMLFDPLTRRLEMSNAGHNFPLLVRSSPEGVKVRPLVSRGNRLGDLRDSRYTSISETLQDGDLLCLYTDGLTEYENAKGAAFGECRLGRLLQRHVDEEPDKIIDMVLAELAAFAQELPQEDDITLVIARVGAS